MNIASAVVIFILVWWCVFFAVLPWGVTSPWEAENDHVKGADPGAPTKPDLKRKALTTTAITFIFWLAIVAFISSGVVNFRE